MLDFLLIYNCVLEEMPSHVVFLQMVYMYHVGLIFPETDMYALFILITAEHSEPGNNKLNS